MARKPDTPCSRCGKLLFRGRGSLPEPICRECRWAHSQGQKRQRMEPLGWQPKRWCDYCGQPLTWKQHRNGNRFCSLLCANAALPLRGIAAIQVRRSDPRANQRKCALRRARKKSAPVVEVVDPTSIFDRDGWKCWLCGGHVDATLSGRHLEGPTMDHIVPLSHGGDHTAANVRLAHRKCNTKRGNRGGGEQLSLVG